MFNKKRTTTTLKKITD